MTSPDSSPDRDEALARLGDEVARALGAGETPDIAALASQFHVTPVEAQHCADALQALHLALGEDLPEAADLPPPTLPPDFELLGELGRGGMGVVYKVRQKSLDRVVALKVLRPAELIIGEAIRRFQTEARSLARLRHRHIVSIHEVGEAGGNVYYTMDLIEGTSLADLISKGKVTPSRAVRLLRQVASAMTYAHSQGLIHRDLKPANILVDPAGDAYVVDFGLARDLAVKADLTASGYLLGTPAYMSPEQARGDTARIGEPTDIYALGAVLYECLAGKAPFAGQPLAETIHSVIHSDPIPPRKLAPRSPHDLEVICLKAMEKKPERRYATVRALLEDLERFEGGLPIRARRPSLAYRGFRFAGRHRVPIAASTIAGAFLSIVLLTVVLPKIGQTPGTLLSTADDLHQAGEHQAAAMLCERALKRDPSGEVEGKLRSSLVRCRLDLARALEAQSRWRDGQRLCEKSLEQSTHGQKVELLWEIARCQANIGETEEAAETIHHMSSEMEDERRAQSGQFFSSVDDHHTLHTLLERMAPALLDPKDPGHEAAGAFITEAFSHFSETRDVIEWLLAQKDRAARLLVAALPFLARCKDFTMQNNPYDVAQKLQDPQFETLLADAVSDPAFSADAQAFAADLLAAQADLPFQMQEDTFDRVPSKPDPDKQRQLVAVWKETRALSRADRHRRLIEAAIREIDHVAPKGRGRDWVLDWLQDHTGLSSRVEKRDRTSEEWKAWWAAHREEDPRKPLALALGLPSIPDANQLLVQYLSNPEKKQRIWLLHLLVLSMPDAVRVPPGRGVFGEPDDRPMDWYRTIRKDRPEPAYTLRRARLLLVDGDPQPELLWEDVVPLPVGVEIRPPERKRTNVRDSLAWGALLPGFESSRPWEGTASETVTGIAALEWRRDGALWVRGGEGGAVGMIFPTDQIDEKSNFMPDHLEASLILNIAEPPGSDPRPWGLDGWKSRIVERLKFLADGLSAESGTKHGGPFAMRYQQSAWLLPRIATFLPLPEARESLVRIKQALHAMDWGLHVQTGEIAAARILAGDADVLAEPETNENLRHHAEMGSHSGAPYWLRVALATTDAKIRTFALERMDDENLPPPVGIRLEEAIRSGRLVPPPRLAHRAAIAAEETARKNNEPRFQYKLTGVLGALLALGLLGLTLRPSHPLQSRLTPAALLLVCGILFASISVEIHGWDLFPDAAGYGLAALGAWILSRAAQGRGLMLSCGAFAVAMVADLIGRLEIAKYTTLYLASLAAAVGISGLIFLVRGLDAAALPGKPIPNRWPLILSFPLYPICALIYHGAAIVNGLRGDYFVSQVPANPATLRPLLLLVLVPLLIALLSAASRRARVVRIRHLPAA